MRRACYGVLRFVLESGAKGAEVTVSGKVRGQRAKSQKFADGYMIKTGHAYEYVLVLKISNHSDLTLRVYRCIGNMWTLQFAT